MGAIMKANHVDDLEFMPPAIVHKTRDNANVFDVPDNGSPPPFDDLQIDIVATVIAEIRAETQDAIDAAVAPLQQRVAVLEGQVSMLVALLGADANNRSVESSEVVRKIKVSR
jgi:hypothetical protein